MPLAPGTRLGPYEIAEKLGAGGMGEVYLGRDSRLDRAVAVKVLPSEVSQDPERRARFEHEARAIAALEHPHICRLYDVGAVDGVDYLVMELLEGKTLAGRLFAGPLPLAEALEIGIQLADALDCAHRRGVVHRDLKPANVVLTPTGPKLLDFGIARLRKEGDEGGTVTQEGQIVGTPHFMAPEQLLGKPVDARADVFALGCLLFEMLAGRRAFATTSLHEPTPSLREAAAETPPALERLVAGCLSVDPEDRWSSARDVKLQLQGILEDHELQTTPRQPEIPMRSRKGSRLPWVLATLSTLAVLALAGLLYFRPLQALALVPGPASPAAPRGGAVTSSVLSVQPPLGITLVPGEAPQISPDGRTLAFVAADLSGQSHLYVRGMDTLEARALPGTDGALLPFWSPDSRQIGFFGGGQLKTIPASGGAPHALADAPVPRGGSWSPGGLILFTAQPNQPPKIVPASGGRPSFVPIGERDQRLFRWFPSFLPDGRHYLYTGYRSATGSTRVVRVGSLDGVETVDVLMGISGSVRFVSGTLLFRRESTLVAQRFDPGTGRLSGEPVPVAEDVGTNPITLQTLFSVSDTGVLAYATTAPVAQLAWFDREGNRLEEVGEPAGYNALCLSGRDGAIVYDLADPVSGNVDLWMLERGSGTPTRLTFDAAVDMYPVCAPDGKQVVFASLRDGPPKLFRVDLDRPGSETVFRESTAPTIPTDLARDGRVVFSVLDPATRWDVAAAPGGEGKPVPIATTEANERHGKLSPNGQFVAYVSNESGTFEVYVKLFSPDGADGARWQISKGGGLQPQWRADSGELYYVSADRKLIGVLVKSRRQRGTDGPDFAVGESRTLVNARLAGWERDSQGGQYAASSDGSRFLVSTATEASVPVTVVLDWAAATAAR